jgi:hypothetical protein
MKNKFMRIAAVMLMLCLVTTCAISGTFAKYTTEAAGTDTARVAYWGFNDVNANLELGDLFKTAYDQNVNGNADVIAPGTTNKDSFKFSYKGYDATVTAPEVAYSFVVSLGDATATYCDDAIQNNPNIDWRLNVIEDSTTTPGTWGSWTDLIAAINLLDGAAGTDGKDYEAGDLPDAFDNDQVYEIEWRWLFDETVTDGVNNDANDTEMGNATELADCKITITITATQKD